MPAQLVAKANDGATFRGRSAQSVVRQMKRRQWSAPARKTEYMEEVAGRVFAATNHPIRTDPASFLHDLAAAGVLEVRIQVEVSVGDARDVVDRLGEYVSDRLIHELRGALGELGE